MWGGGRNGGTTTPPRRLDFQLFVKKVEKGEKTSNIQAPPPELIPEYAYIFVTETE